MHFRHIDTLGCWLSFLLLRYLRSWPSLHICSMGPHGIAPTTTLKNTYQRQQAQLHIRAAEQLPQFDVPSKAGRRPGRASGSRCKARKCAPGPVDTSKTWMPKKPRRFREHPSGSRPKEPCFSSCLSWGLSEVASPIRRALRAGARFHPPCGCFAALETAGDFLEPRRARELSCSHDHKEVMGQSCSPYGAYGSKYTLPLL